MKQTIADRIKIAVKETGGQVKFAKAVGFDQGVISRVVNNKKEASQDLIKAIVIKLGYSPSWLFTGEGEKKTPKQQTELMTDLKDFRKEIDLTRAKINSYEYDVEQLRKSKNINQYGTNKRF